MCAGGRGRAWRDSCFVVVVASTSNSRHGTNHRRGVSTYSPRLADGMRRTGGQTADRDHRVHSIRNPERQAVRQTPAGKAFIGTLPPPQCRATGLANSKVVVGPWGATPPSLSLQPLPLQTRSVPSLLSPGRVSGFGSRLPAQPAARFFLLSSPSFRALLSA